jgi:DNA polymerase-3 subunit delta
LAASPDAVFSETLKALASGSVAPVYLLYGDEDYLQEEFRRRILALLPDPSTADFNCERLDAETCSPTDVRNAVETLPFLGGRKFVIVRRAELLEAGVEALAPCLEDPPASACLVLLAGSLKASSKLLKAVRKRGVAVPTDMLKGRTLMSAVKRMAARRGFKLEGEALSLVAERSSGVLWRVASELEKLALHVEAQAPAGDKAAVLPEISLEVVIDVVDDGRTDNLFDLTNALGARDGAKALDALELLLRRQHAATVLVSVMARHVVRLLEVRSLLDAGVPAGSVPKRMGGSPYYIRKLTEQAQRFSDAELRSALAGLQRADIQLRGSGYPDRILLERLVIDLCRLRNGGGKGGLRRRPISRAGGRAPAG